MVDRKRVLSGVQPTGSLHLGNYLGAIRNWVETQADYQSFFCVVDLHAITIPHQPQLLADHTRGVAALYIACGIDPQQSTIFVQSQVSAHTELTWLLNCVTPLNWLERMIQFKEKAIKQGENVSVGLLDYPVLMAADILLYQADLVPVGEDQKQHLELTRDLAARFNDQFGLTFKLPEPLIRKQGARVMSLLDGTKKMSKSDANDGSRINLLDAPEAIAKKIKRCKTDLNRELEFDQPERPECHNLMTLYMLLTGKTKEAVTTECANLRGWGDFKNLLTEAAIAHLEPIQTRYQQVIQAPDYLDQILEEGKSRAMAIADHTLQTAKQNLGFFRGQI